MQTQEEIIANLTAELETLKANQKPTKRPKGDKVKFTTQKGVEVEGYGVLYYCTRFDGKLVYKEASTVEVLEYEKNLEKVA